MGLWPWHPRSSLHWQTLSHTHTGLLSLKPPLCVIRWGVELNWLCMIQSAAGPSYSTSQMDESLLVSHLTRWIATSWKMHLYIVGQAFSTVPHGLQSNILHPGQTCPSTFFDWKCSCFCCSVHPRLSEKQWFGILDSNVDWSYLSPFLGVVVNNH